LSEIRVTTISDTAGTGPVTLTKQSAAKAWCSFNGTGTVAIRGSFNTSSITDRGTGAYTQNFSSAMGDINYSCTLTSPRSADSNQVGIFCGNSSDSSAPTTTAVQMNEIAGATFYDVDLVNTAINGDLA